MNKIDLENKYIYIFKKKNIIKKKVLYDSNNKRKWIFNEIYIYIYTC